MKTSSFFLRLVLGVLVFLAGAASMRIWDHYHLAPAHMPVEVAPLSAVFEMDMSQAQMPQGVEDAQAEAHKLVPAHHSQIAKVNLPDVQAIIPRSGNAYETEEDVSKKMITPPVQITGDYPSVTEIPAATPAEEPA